MPRETIVTITETVRVTDTAKLLAYAKDHAYAWGMSEEELEDVGTAAREAVVLHLPSPSVEEIGIEMIGSDVSLKSTAQNVYDDIMEADGCGLVVTDTDLLKDHIAEMYAVNPDEIRD